MEPITSKEMAVLDLNCEYYGLSRLQLMENAGMAVADEVLKLNPSSVAVFAGLGNNGGDSLVSARILTSYTDVEVYIMGNIKDIKTNIARKNFEVLKTSGAKIFEITHPSKLHSLDGADCVVDAMLGTGVRGELREPYSTAVDLINQCNAEVIAVDVPTGLNPDTGEFVKAVKADTTVTFHRPKPGLLKPEVKEIVGKLVIKNIGIPLAFERLAGPGDVKLTFKRFADGHKGTHGRILVVGGGPYTGAPALASLAALKVGADLSVLAVPKEIKNIVSSYSPELIVRGFDDAGEIEHIHKCHSAVVGMGMEEKLAKKVVEVISGFCRKLVLDASALGAVDAVGDAEVILTPHRGELEKYFGLNKNAGIDEVKSLAKDLNATILLKGREDLITDGKKLKINRTGNAGMTVGGTGDVLAGVCGAFLSKSDPLSSAVTSAFVVGMAGDLCLEELGYCYTALDVVSKLPIAVKKSLEFS
ncbi:MAG: bifunctional ADP-dependent NAD(P)H-hydrate dehydratase/NAD(P)H-hydrate epimerase [Archaeoglobus sp.]|nr:MAG: bifunctional ADP-dependent NAD(P)H-hydrate dehydratase/NAD(P)H-hydrate epimerase [Archaeoglobus sp.]